MSASKMTELDVVETSGVDHPAHLVEGWIVMKQADRQGVDEVLAALALDPSDNEGDNVDAQVEELTKALEEAQAEIEVLKAQIDAQVDPEPEDEDEEAALMKSVPEPVREMLEKARAEADEVRAELQKAKDAEADREYIAKAAAWEHLRLRPRRSVLCSARSPISAPNWRPRSPRLWRPRTLRASRARSSTRSVPPRLRPK